MPLVDWSETILIVELSDDPSFSDDMDLLRRRLEDAADQDEVPNIILNLSGVSHLNSSNIAQLLTVRKKLTHSNRKLRICSVQDSVWSVLLTTGLDAVFNFTEDVSTSLASLQMT